MNTKATIILLLLYVTTLHAQTNIIIPNYLRMPKDSIQTQQIIKDLNGFINAAQYKNGNNPFVLSSQKIETFILLDEFKNIENSKAFKNKHFFKPYLNNFIKIDNNKYAIQLSHIGIDNDIPYLRTMYNLIAIKTDNGFKFSSPLIQNTQNWKSKKFKNTTFHYKANNTIKNMESHAKMIALFDEKLNSKNRSTEIYYTENRNELLKIIGVDYRLDYNGKKNGIFSATSNNEQLIVIGKKDKNIDYHDLWHDRLNLVKSRRLLNKPIDEACAYLYGGSWGLTWQEIYSVFKEKIANNKNADWKYYKENPTNFANTKREHLMVDYVINALIIQKIEKEQGFKAVWTLLDCGKFEKGNKNYYKALEKLTGITEENYNIKVWELINNYKM